jgi:hypothetical protein
MRNMGVSRPANRPFTTSVAAASAGMLAAGLVAVPPEVDAVQTEVRAVHLAAFPIAQEVAAILTKAVDDQREIVAAVPSEVVGNAHGTTSLTFVRTVEPTGDATQAVAPAIDSPQATTDASAIPSANSILGGLLVGAFFFVVIPAFLVVIYVASAIDVVLGALGLPLLALVPDPPFGPTPPTPAIASTAKIEPPTGDPAAPEPKKTFAETDTVGYGPPLNDPVAPKKRGGAPSTDTVQADSLPVDPPDTDTATTSKPLTNVTKDSADFTPKRRDHENPSSDSDSARASTDQTADLASTADQQSVGHVGKKPKPDAAGGEQEAGE